MEEYFASEECTLYKSDCLEVLRGLEDNSVGLTITSPPYNMNLRVMGKKYVSRCRNRNHGIEFSNKYTNYTDDLTLEEYYAFQKEVLSQCLRISQYVFYNTQMVTGNKPSLFRLLGEFNDKIKEVIIWDKMTSQPAMQEGVLNSQFEFIFILEKNNPHKRQFDACGFSRGSESNLWGIKRERNTDSKAAFPLGIPDKILKMFPTENKTVLDPFMGSGTTAIACIDNGYKFIGAEIDEDTIAKAKIRILARLGRK
jgi:site-specific DNA-methyltransferase (adenine-specific)